MAGEDSLYQPGPGPTGTPDVELAEYLQRELNEIARVLSAGTFQLMRLDKWGTLPPKPRNGDIAYFLDSVVPAPGGPEGLYMYVGARSRWESIKTV